MLTEQLTDRPGCLTRIEAVLSSLSKAEQRVATYMRDNPREVTSLTIVELARRAGVGEATVTRVCRSLGFPGYQAAKVALAHDVATETLVNVPRAIGPDDGPQQIAQTLAAVLKAALDGASRAIQPEALAMACEMISRAHKVVFYGIGSSGILAGLGRNALMNLGLTTDCYAEGYLQAVSSCFLNREDVVVAISHSGTTADVVSAAARAREAGAFTICITSDPASPLAECADICLTTESAEVPTYGEFMEARVGQMYLLYLLYLGVALRMRDRAARNLERAAEAVWAKSYGSSRRVPDGRR